MHHLRLALLAAALCCASFGCATPAEEPAAKSPAAGTAQTEASQPRPNSGTYRTGSRLPQHDSDGSSSTGTQSKDDYADEMRRNPNPMRGN